MRRSAPRVRLGLTLSRFGAASINIRRSSKLRDGPFAVKLNAVGVYERREGGRAHDRQERRGIDAELSGRPSMKQNGFDPGPRPHGPAADRALVFSEEGRRRRQARRTLVARL